MSTTEPSADHKIIRLTGRIVSAYMTNNRIDRLKVGELAGNVHKVLAGLTSGDVSEASVEAGQPSVPIKRSVTPYYISCLECGMRLKMLKRHLRTHHNLTPQEYRVKWALAHDYPMVAPNYAELRSDLAREAGLGGPPTKARGRR